MEDDLTMTDNLIKDIKLLIEKHKIVRANDPSEAMDIENRIVDHKNELQAILKRLNDAKDESVDEADLIIQKIERFLNSTHLSGVSYNKSLEELMPLVQKIKAGHIALQNETHRDNLEIQELDKNVLIARDRTMTNMERFERTIVQTSRFKLWFLIVIEAVILLLILFF